MASSTLKYNVKGMDCASCVSKIERAVKHIPGVHSVTVGLQSETLAVAFSGSTRGADIEAAVRSLGYQVTASSPSQAETPPEVSMSTENHDSDSHGDGDHSDHGEPIEGAWWESTKGRLAIATAVLLGFAYLERYLLPFGSQLLFLVASAVGTIPIARRAFAAWRVGAFFTIEMLMTIAVIGAIVIGAAEEAAVVVLLFTVGELLEGVAAGRARSSIKSLTKLAPQTAMVESKGDLVETPVSNLALGSLVVVRPGDRVPADGVIISGQSTVDESALTGESVPRNRSEGDTILAGSINIEAVLRVRVDKPASDTLIARVVRLVEQAADAKAPSERFIERFAAWYMPVICLLAVAVAMLPPLVLQQDWNVWIYRGLALLLIGCPCALVISTPASITAALAAGARKGLLVKGGGILEAIGKVRHIAFDKTGTLTAGKPIVTNIVPLNKQSSDDILKLVASIESGSSHPLAQAIVAEAQLRKLSYDPVASQVLPGKGIEGVVKSQTITIGAAPRLGVTDRDVLAKMAALEDEGKSVSVVLRNQKPIGLIALRDEPRADALAGIDEIKSLGLNPIMLTGDNRANAQAVAEVLGMEVRAELLPEDKLEIIRQRAGDGGIAKVGDGINDAPALAAATVGIAMGSGTDVALEAADAAILNNRISDVASLVRLSRQTIAVIRQNVAIALGLKVIFLVTTILGLTGLWIAILADTGATVLVTLNALRLLRARI